MAGYMSPLRGFGLLAAAVDTLVDSLDMRRDKMASLVVPHTVHTYMYRYSCSILCRKVFP